MVKSVTLSTLSLKQLDAIRLVVDGKSTNSTHQFVLEALCKKGVFTRITALFTSANGTTTPIFGGFALTSLGYTLATEAGLMAEWSELARVMSMASAEEGARAANARLMAEAIEAHAANGVMMAWEAQIKKNRVDAWAHDVLAGCAATVLEGDIAAANLEMFHADGKEEERAARLRSVISERILLMRAIRAEVDAIVEEAYEEAIKEWAERTAADDRARWARMGLI